MEDSNVFCLTRPMPFGLRIVFGAIGLFAIVAPAWDFRDVFLHPGWFSLFFGAIVLGAWSVGGSLVWAAIVGEDQRWRVTDREIEISRRNLWRSWSTTVRGADVSATTIRESEWDSGPNTYSVVLQLHGGEEFETPGCGEREGAIALEARLRRSLHLD